MPRPGRPPSWTPSQLAYLKAQAQIEPVYYPARALGMNESTARWYLKQWGISPLPRRQNWSPDDEEYLRRNVETMTLAALASALSRSEASVRVKAHKLGLSVHSKTPRGRHGRRRFWSREEDIFLYDAAPRMSLREAASRLGRSPASVHHRCRRLGIRWTQGRRSIREVAQDLGCHPSYVRRLAQKVGVALPATKGGGMMHVKDAAYEALCEAWMNGGDGNVKTKKEEHN